jgi:hypothetical protein
MLNSILEKYLRCCKWWYALVIRDALVEKGVGVKGSEDNTSIAPKDQTSFQDL